MALLEPDEPAPFAIEHAYAGSDFFLTCDHAGRRIPRALGDLGLPPAERDRHIGWDIGAAGLATALSRRLDAVMVAQPYSRLVVDCNRPLRSAQLIPERSERTDIPGNAGLVQAEREARVDAIHRPYHEQITAMLDARAAAGRPTVFVAVHTFTPVYLEQSRPWQISVLSGEDRRFSEQLLVKLREDARFCIGDNEPYTIDEEDFGIPVHGIGRGLPNVLLEIRQDLVTDARQQLDLAEHLATALTMSWARLKNES